MKVRNYRAYSTLLDFPPAVTGGTAAEYALNGIRIGDDTISHSVIPYERRLYYYYTRSLNFSGAVNKFPRVHAVSLSLSPFYLLLFLFRMVQNGAARETTAAAAAWIGTRGRNTLNPNELEFHPAARRSVAARGRATDN